MTESPDPKNQDLRWALLPLGLALLVWLPLLGSPMMVDERVMTWNARKWIALDPLAPWQGHIGGSGTWRPLLVYSYWLDAGLPVPVRHGLHILLHAVLVGLAWLWLRGAFGLRAAVVGSCFLAIHPAHVATAGWLGGRADLTMSLCAVAALLLAQRGRPLLCALAVIAAILCKETGVALLPMLLLCRRPGGVVKLAPAFVGGAVAAGLSLLKAEPAAGYLPTVEGVVAGLPALLTHSWETIVPWFNPVGLRELPRDQLGAALALPMLAVAGLLGLRRPEGRRGLGLMLLALLPVIHVLPNDGGQWYLLLPSLGAAWLWASVVPEGRWLPLVLAALLLTLCCALWEGRAWSRAAARVHVLIAAGVDPGVQDPVRWPHRGPSFCCGLPYEVVNDLPRGWGGVDESELKPGSEPRVRDPE